MGGLFAMMKNTAFMRQSYYPLSVCEETASLLVIAGSLRNPEGAGVKVSTQNIIHGNTK